MRFHINRLYRTLIIALLPIVFCSSTNGGITGDSMLCGKAIDIYGKPVADVNIEIYCSALAIKKVTHTEEDGFYCFPPLPPGKDYILRVNSPGYIPLALSHVIVRPCSRVYIRIEMIVTGEAWFTPWNRMIDFSDAGGTYIIQ